MTSIARTDNVFDRQIWFRLYPHKKSSAAGSNCVQEVDQ